MHQALGTVHAIVLAALAWHAATRLVAGGLERISAAALLIWGNLVATGLLLATVSRLDRVGLYCSLSVLLAAALCAVLTRRRVMPHRIALPPDPGPDTAADRGVRVGLAASFFLAALASAVICVAYVPNNWDSATYRLSRPFFYLGQGNLLHTGNPGDPRLDFYPLNGVLAYVFLAAYRYAAPWMSLVTYLAWLGAGAAVYMAARRLGASPTGAAVAAWLCWLTPNVLAQATATTDEVLNAVPILLGLVFAFDFWTAGLTRHALLAGLGIGLGLGTKLHWVFYWTTVAAAVVAVAIGAGRRPALRRVLARRLPAAAAGLALAGALGVPFMAANYLSADMVTNAGFNNLVLNRPFRLSLALEKIRVNTAELFLSPLPDLVPPVDRAARQAAYAAFNRFFMRCCFSDLVETVKRPYPGGYAFVGPASHEGFHFYEYTWLGFLPHLLLLIGLTSLVAPRALPRAGVALVLAFFAWHATNAMQTRYQAGQIYYSFAAVLAVAAAGPAWDFARTSKRWAARALLVGFAAVFATHALLAFNLLQFGGLRNLQFLWRWEPAPDRHPVDPPVITALRAARTVYLPETHWELLYWNFMRFNPGARYTTGGEHRLPAPDTLMLLSLLPRIDAGTLPARLPPGEPRGLTYLGRADGDHVFAQGDGVDARFPDRSGYALVRIQWRRDPASGAIGDPDTLACCVGLDVPGRVEVRYELTRPGGGPPVALGWSRPGQPAVRVPASGGVRYDALLIDVRRDGVGPVLRSRYRLDREYYEVDRGEPLSVPSRAP